MDKSWDDAAPDTLIIRKNGRILLGEKPETNVDGLFYVESPSVSYNIEKLKNDPNLSFIKVKLNELADNVIATNGNDATLNEYRRFYNITYEILLDVLQNADELYWYYKTRVIR